MIPTPPPLGGLRTFASHVVASADVNETRDRNIDTNQMIAPQNPPPPIPLGGVVAGHAATKRWPTVNTNGATGGSGEYSSNGHSHKAPPPPNGHHSAAAASAPSKMTNGNTPTAAALAATAAAVNVPLPPPPKIVQSENGVVSKPPPPAVDATTPKLDANGLPIYPKLKLNGFVGFASLPYQVVRRCQQQGFQFNLLCVGETGTGKTTLLESLFGIKLTDFEPCNNELNTVELRTKQCEITDSNVNVKLRIIETAGFGDQLDKEKSAKVIIDYINSQYEKRLKEELKVKRGLPYAEDSRIHACLYFISPTGHGLKALDVVTMKELSKRVNVIPVIAKSDTTSKEELVRFKSKILAEVRNHGIDIYQFPTDDEATAEQNRRMNTFMPFAVVGSIDFVKKEDGSVVRARRYPWGIVEVENKEHCDFIYLREAILRTNVDALRERTHKVLYEAYRRSRLRELRMRDGDAGANMERACEQRKIESAKELERRDAEFNTRFVSRVDEKEIELKRREELLNIHRREVEEAFQRDIEAADQQLEALRDERARLDGHLERGKKSRK